MAALRAWGQMMRSFLVGLAAAAAASLGIASAAAAGPVDVTYYHGFSETVGVGITFSDAFFSETLDDINFSYGTAGCVANGRPDASCGWGGDFTGFLGVSATGTYDLTLGSDDASYLFIDGDLVASLPGSHSHTTTTLPILLTAGNHAFELQYYNTFCCGASVQLSLDEGVIFSPGVPEPATWAMMIGGFAGMGAMLRRRRTAAA